METCASCSGVGQISRQCYMCNGTQKVKLIQSKEKVEYYACYFCTNGKTMTTCMDCYQFPKSEQVMTSFERLKTG